MFSALDIAASGLDATQTWINAVSDNIANINTVRPTSQAAYQTRYVEVADVPGTFGPGSTPESQIGAGVAVTGVAFSSPQGQLVYDPTNPMADSRGMVRGNSVDLGAQMTDMMIAQRGFQANVSSIKAAQQAYQSALELKS